jgi:hypothetical protein
MRLVVLLAVLCLGACAGEKLAQVPPAGVDFSGRWKLNEADSDDPQRLLQAQINAPTTDQSGAPAPSGGRGSRRGGGGDPSAMRGPTGPVMPSVGVMSEGLQWPGKQLEIKQVAGVVAFTSDGVNLVCQPAEGRGGHGHDHPERDGTGRGDAAPRARDTPPPRCGWLEKTLIVMEGDADEERPPFEKHYSLSDDRQRLVEVVGFKEGRSNGFTMSRVWDRSNQ